MRKKAIMLMCACSCMIVVACGGSPTISETNSTQEQGEESTNSSVNQVSEQQNQVPEESEKQELQFEVCNLGDIITTDFVEITVEAASILENLYPTDTSGAYSYIEGKEGEQFFCLIGTLKNIAGNTYNVRYMNIEMIFDSKYTYIGSVAADDGGRNFMGYDVKPLSTVKFYIYSSIPDELINSYSTCTIRFAFKENFEQELFTDFSLYDYRYQIELEKNNSHSVAVEETEGLNIDDKNSIDGNYIADLLEKYPEYVNELSNYVTSIHRQDFVDGKSFRDFEDYGEYFEDFYSWANEIIDYQGEVASEYQELWKEFQSLIKYHIDILNESYNKNNEEALKMISQLMNYIQDKSKIINQLISDLK